VNRRTDGLGFGAISLGLGHFTLEETTS